MSNMVEVRSPPSAPALRLFEDICIVRDGHESRVHGDGRRALLALLASHAGRIVPVERLLDALWGDAPPASAPKIIQTYVSQLRRLLEPDRHAEWEVLVTRPPGYVLAIQGDAIDVAAFESAVGAARRREQGARFADALARWIGEPYPGLDHDFARAEADRLRALHREALAGRCAEQIAAGDARGALADLESLAREDRTDEAVAALRLEALWRSGQRSAALHEYDELRTLLADELGIDPGPEVADLHLRMLRDELPSAELPPAEHEPKERAPEQSDDRIVPRLPRERTGLIGRAEHVRSLVAAVAQEPLVTVIGPGGAGKTRVALRVAHTVAEGGQAWWVGFAGLTDPVALPSHVARAIGLPPQFEAPGVDALADWLMDQSGLLVLDNCEHLVEPVAGLVGELLDRAPGVRILATSRVPLHVHGERRWRIPPLGLPEQDTAEALRESASGRLLLERAGRAGDSFALDAGDAAHLARVCRRLDGVPLALELAAARLAGMSPADLDAGLDARFRLLTAGDVSGPSQHRTLRATTEWTYRLLAPEHRALLDRMAVFVGPVEAAAVIEVCADSTVPAAEVPALLADLVEWSVVGLDRDRYGLLETVREFGRENLGESVVSYEERHGEWAARLVERIGREVQEQTMQWVRELESHVLDLRAAFDRALARDDAALAMRLAGEGNWALLSAGRLPLLRSWVSRSLEAGERSEVPARLRGEVELLAGAVAGLSGQPDRAMALLTSAGERLRSVGEVEQALWVQYWTATALGEQGRFDESVAIGLAAADDAAEAGLGAIEANLRAGVAEVALVGAFAAGPVDSELREVMARETARGLALCEGGTFEEAELRLLTNDALVRAVDSPGPDALDECLGLVARWKGFGRGPRLAVALTAVASVAAREEAREASVALAEEALDVLGFLGWEGPLPTVLGVVAVLGVERDPVTCARLLGAARTRWATYRWRLPCDPAKAEASLRSALGADRYRQLREEGESLPAAKAVEAATRVLRAAASATAE